MNRLGNAIFMLFPIYFRTGRTWRRVLFFIRISAGSVLVESDVNPGDNVDLTQAQSDLSNSMATGTIEGTSTLATSVAATVVTDTEENSSSNLPIIMGVAIPLIVLCTFEII